MSSGGGFRTLDPLGPEDWDGGNSGFMQSRFWALFKTHTGWKARVLMPAAAASGASADAPTGAPSSAASGVLILDRPLRLGLSFAYIPFGPEKLPEGIDPSAYLSKLAASLVQASGSRPVFLRVDLPWEKDPSGGATALAGFRRAAPVQVPDTVVVDLRQGLDELLGGMKPKWRYNIKLAERRGVVVSREGREALPLFYDLYRETSARDGIAIHPLSYYEKLFEVFGDPSSGEGEGDDLSLWVAREGGEILAAIITLFHRRHATYLYGASSDRKRNLMPAYALQWSAMCAAKEAGCVDYDLFGIPPNEDPTQPMAGLYLFKTGFGGRILNRVGAVDLPLRPLLYFAFKALESLRLVWHKGIKKMVARARRAADQRKTSPSKA